MRVIAMYLPQFHKVKENDEWWGDGFTDWVSAKNAKPLFDGHYQPHIPLNENYYDLMQKDTMIWQANLMHQYGVDGLCFYHYWFKDGRHILEKPAENLLSWTDIDMHFCFSWANETWARSWSRLMGVNVWSNLNEPSRKSGDKAVLLEQAYGDRAEWIRHFEYFLHFFRDKRYIKVDEKPLLMIYKTDIIPCLGEMIDCWRGLALVNGFPGIYVIGSNCNSVSEGILDAKLMHEPMHAFSILRNTSKITDNIECYDYSSVWEQILKTRRDDVKTYFGGFVGYDETPRRGREGLVINNQSPKLFCDYLTCLMAKNEQYGNDITFLNAWNEWGEGMHLEPDEKYGYAYLEAVIKAKSNYLNMPTKYEAEDNNLEITALKRLCGKYEKNMKVFDAWMRIREKGQSLASYFERKGYKRIAMYGYGLLGKHFVKEIECSDITLSYIIDRQGNRINADIPIYGIESEYEDVDTIVISVTFDVDMIKDELLRKGFQNIVTVEDIIMEIECW